MFKGSTPPDLCLSDHSTLKLEQLLTPRHACSINKFILCSITSIALSVVCHEYAQNALYTMLTPQFFEHVQNLATLLMLMMTELCSITIHTR